MLDVRLLGGATVERSAGKVASVRLQPRRLAVLAVIARAGVRGISRDRLTAVLWPDASPAGGRRALSQALWALRRDLACDALFLGVQTLQLNPAVAACDVVRFEEALGAGRLADAARSYGGPLLEGFRLPLADDFEHWLELERAVLARQHTAALERLGREAAASGDTAGAVDWWRRLARAEPLSARPTLALMRALRAAGDRSAALHEAQTHAATVGAELGGAPDPAIVALEVEIRREIAAETVVGVTRDPRPVPATVTVPLLPAEMPRFGEPSRADAASPRAMRGLVCPEEIDASPASPPIRSQTAAVGAAPVATPPITPRPLAGASMRLALAGLFACCAVGVAAEVNHPGYLRTGRLTAADPPVVALGTLTDFRTGATFPVAAAHRAARHTAPPRQPPARRPARRARAPR
jgi:DNA-binding SARP family transcriptional activator